MLEDLKIGIIGAGAISCNLLKLAEEWKLNITLLSPEPPLLATCTVKTGDPQDARELMDFGKDCSKILVLDNRVHRPALQQLRQKGVRIYPNPDLLDLLADEPLLHQHLRTLSIPVYTERRITAPLFSLANGKEAEPQVSEMFEQTHSAFHNGHTELRTRNGHSYREQEADSSHDEKMVEVLMARWPDGWIECYDPVMMLLQSDRMLVDFRMRAPGLHSRIAINACQLAAKIADALQVQGLMTVCLQYDQHGQLWFKTIKPWPAHSSGIVDFNVLRSGFEQERRALLHLPASRSEKQVVVNNTPILEPAAHRRHAREEALKLVLGLLPTDPDSKTAEAIVRSRGGAFLSDIDMEDFISKSLMIRYLLSV